MKLNGLAAWINLLITNMRTFIIYFLSRCYLLVCFLSDRQTERQTVFRRLIFG